MNQAAPRSVYQVVDGCLMVDQYFPDQLLERVELLRRIQYDPSSEVAMSRERLLLIGNIPHLHIMHGDLDERCNDISRLASGLENSGRYDVVLVGSRQQAKNAYFISNVYGRYATVVITLPDDLNDFLTGAELLQAAADLKKEDPSLHVTVVAGKEALMDYKPRLERERVRFEDGAQQGTVDTYYDRESLLALLEGTPASQQEVDAFVQRAKRVREQRRANASR